MFIGSGRGGLSKNVLSWGAVDFEKRAEEKNYEP